MPDTPALALKPLVWLMFLPLAMSTKAQQVNAMGLTQEIEDKTFEKVMQILEQNQTFMNLELKNSQIGVKSGTQVRAAGTFKITDANDNSTASSLTLSGAGSKLSADGETIVAGSTAESGKPVAVMVDQGAALDLSMQKASFSNSGLVVTGKDSVFVFSKQGLTLNAASLMISDQASMNFAATAISDPGEISLMGNDINRISVTGGSELVASKLSGGANTKVKLVVEQGGKMAINHNSQLETVSISVNDLDLTIAGAQSELRSQNMQVDGQAVIVLRDGGQLMLDRRLTLNKDDASIFIGGQDQAAAPGVFKATDIKFKNNTGKQRLVFNHTDQSGGYRFTTAIDGQGSIEHKAGHTVLSGQTLAGKTTVSGGTLGLEEVTLNGELSVGQGGTLDLISGKLGNTQVKQGGRLTVSAVPAEVNGTLTLEPGALLAVTVDGKTQGPLVKASGAATITDAGLSVTAREGFKLGTAYTVLEGQSLTGQFKDVQMHDSGAFLTSTLVYTGKAATVTLQKKTTFDQIAADGNARAAGRGVESLDQDAPLYHRVLMLPEGQATRTLQHLSGDAHASVHSVLRDMVAASPQTAVPMRHLRGNLNAGLAPGAPLAQFGGGLSASALPAPADLPMWAEVTGLWQRLDGRQGRPDVRANTGGVFLGTDRAVWPAWRLGAAAGFTHTHVDVAQRSVRAAIDNYSASLYGGRHWSTGVGHLNLILGVAYTWHGINTRRDMRPAGLPETLKARHGANTWQLFTELGHRMSYSPTASVEPYAGLAWSNLRTRAFNEGGGVAALHGRAQSQHGVTTTLGLRGAWNMEIKGRPAVLSAHVGWRHLSGDPTPRNTLAFNSGQPFTVAGNAIARNMALVELGGKMAVGRHATLGLSYGGQFSAAARQHGATLRARWAF